MRYFCVTKKYIPLCDTVQNRKKTVMIIVIIIMFNCSDNNDNEDNDKNCNNTCKNCDIQKEIKDNGRL